MNWCDKKIKRGRTNGLHPLLEAHTMEERDPEPTQADTLIFRLRSKESLVSTPDRRREHRKSVDLTTSSTIPAVFSNSTSPRAQFPSRPLSARFHSLVHSSSDNIRSEPECETSQIALNSSPSWRSRMRRRSRGEDRPLSPIPLLPDEEELVVLGDHFPSEFEYSQYSIRAGTTSAFLCYLLNFHDTEFQKIFLLTHRLYTASKFVLNRLQKEYGETKSKDKRRRILQIVHDWVDRYWHYDFQEEPDLYRQLDAFLSRVEKKKRWADRVAHIRQMIESKQALFDPSPRMIAPPLSLDRRSEVLAVGQIPPRKLAQQIAIQSFRRFSAITPAELLSQAWSGERKHTHTPNIVRCVDLVNVLARSTVQNILAYAHVQKRADALCWYLDLANELFQLRDISSALAIVAGVESIEISRLSRTWDTVGESWKQKRTELNALLGPQNNYQKLRKYLKDAPTDAPLVPFIGLFLRDLTFIEDGNPTFTSSRLINMEKGEMIYRVLDFIHRCQKLDYQPLFKELQQYQDWITSWVITDEEVVFQRSVMLEPRSLDWEAYENLIAKYDESRGYFPPPSPMPAVDNNSLPEETPDTSRGRKRRKRFTPSIEISSLDKMKSEPQVTLRSPRSLKSLGKRLSLSGKKGLTFNFHS